MYISPQEGPFLRPSDPATATATANLTFIYFEYIIGIGTQLFIIMPYLSGSAPPPPPLSQHAQLSRARAVLWKIVFEDLL